MPKWKVETQATVLRIYEVEAANQKEAEAAACDSAFVHEEDVTEETMSITAIAPHKREEP